MSDIEEHWQKIYTTKTPDEVSWTQDKPTTSLRMIQSLHLPKDAAIIDVGGGDSRLVDYLIEDGYEDITVLDISAAAIERAKDRLGAMADSVSWIVTDIRLFEPEREYVCWHDRACFHFLTEKDAIHGYRTLVEDFVTSYLVIASFSTDGPLKCSALNVQQYDEESMTSLWRGSFHKISCHTETHLTPFDSTQDFLFCSYKRG